MKIQNIKSERKIGWMKIIATFAIALLIFISGLYMGTVITQSKVNDILSVEKQARLELDNMAVEGLLLEENPCLDPTHLSESLNDLGVKLTYLEAQYNKNNPKILELKKPYTLLEIRHYLSMKKMIENCNYNYTLVLFFYSNSEEKIDESEEQGFVLDYLGKKFDNLKIYSFDSDLDMPTIKTIKEVYGITVTPSTVIDGKVYAGFHDKDELEEVLSKQ